MLFILKNSYTFQTVTQLLILLHHFIFQNHFNAIFRTTEKTVIHESKYLAFY